MTTNFKRILTTIFFISICFVTYAQYPPFIEPGKTWRELVEAQAGWWFLDEYQMTGDTLINGTQYQKLEMVNSSDSNVELPYYTGALREDTVEKKVHIVFPNTSNELLLYDFDLNVGDQHTFNYCYHPNVAPSMHLPETFTVDSIASYTDDTGVTRKIWYLDYSHVGIVGRIIEGVGSNTGVIAYSCAFEYWTDMVCVHKDSTALFVNEMPFYNYCTPFIYNSISEIIDKNIGLSIYPNPSQGNLVLESTDLSDLTKVKISTLDQLGRIIQLPSSVQFDKINFDTSDLKNGLYYLVIQTEKNTITRKIVIEN